MVKHTIDHYISNLLYFNECVVVPEFGAFLTRYFPAEINPATHMFRPPSKRVAFNTRIQENDGLLAKHIANTEGVSYEKAMESILISVRSWKKVLRAGKKINLTGIGRLYMSDTGKLQFNPAHDINYDIQSYGLNIFRANAMERDQEIKRSVNKAIEKHQSNKKSAKEIAAKKVESNKEPKVRNLNLRPWVGVLGPVAALLLVGAYLYTNPGTTNTVKEQVSSIFQLDTASSSFGSESSKPIETSESSIGFQEGERLNGDFGPEDDVISEQDEAVETTAELNKTEDQDPLVASEDELETPEESTPIMEDFNSHQDSQVVAELEDNHSDNAVALEVQEIPKQNKKAKKAKNIIDADFYLPKKPLYNVKKRPDGENTSNESSPYSPYRIPNSGQQTLEKEITLPDPGASRGTSQAKENSSQGSQSKPVKAQAATEPNRSKSTLVKSNDAQPQSTMQVNSGEYQIIVGAFSDLANANAYVSKLKSQGWSAYTYRSGSLNRVAIGRLSNQKQAQNLLMQVKQQVNAQAWVFQP